MKKLFVLSVILILAFPLRATTLIVDQNGGGQFTTIPPAIQAANPGDTVKVWPGYYTEQVNLDKDITLMGSGYENTVIVGTSNPMVIMGIGSEILQWFQITSTGGNGINLSGGTVKNCVIIGSSGNGINGSSGTSQVINCVLYQNVGAGINVSGGTTNATNCISRLNGNYGYSRGYMGTLSLSYSNGSHLGTSGNVGCVDCDPPFENPPFDFHIDDPPTPNCSWNTGNPSLPDPDGSIADMGYFGGPDCPIYPTVVEILIEPNGNNINLTAKARANY